jgi:hypothetical protein
MWVILIATDPVDLQRLRDFGSKANYASPQRGELPDMYFTVSRPQKKRHAQPSAEAASAAAWAIGFYMSFDAPKRIKKNSDLFLVQIKRLPATRTYI